MDDLLFEVRKRQTEKLTEADYPRTGRRGSGTVIGFKQFFTGLRNLDSRFTGKTQKYAEVSVDTSPPVTPGGSLIPVTYPNQAVDRGVCRLYASSTDVRHSDQPTDSVPLTSTPVSHKKNQLEEMKKIPTDPRIVGKHKAPSSNTQWYVTNEYLGLPPSGGTLQHAATSDAPLSSVDPEITISDVSDGSGATNTVTDEPMHGGATGDQVIDTQLDSIDSHDGQIVIDPQKTKEAIEHYRRKIDHTMQALQKEQQVKQENVNEYLQLATAAEADKIQSNRIKAVFEKKNQKSTHTIGRLQRKLEVYKKHLKEVETYGVSDKGKGMLKDVGHGIKTIVSKPKEFVHLLRNKSGSADNISSLECIENGQHSEEILPTSTRRESITLPPHFKYHSTDNMVALDGQTSVPLFLSDPSAQQGAPARNRHQLSNNEFADVVKQLQQSKSVQDALRNCIADLQNKIGQNHHLFKQALEEEKIRREHLEEQVNDLMELHQNEVTNLKQELSSMEEKMEYQLEERTRDMQDLLESCQTKITKMDLQQQQQQQLISMESFDNSTVRTLVTKLINVVLALLAVILVLINTTTNMLEPFVNTRFRCVATIVIVFAAALMWQHSDLISSSSKTTNNWFRSFINL